MDVSIIVVSFNTRGVLRECLQSIQSANLRLSYEVIIVDNASCDGSAQMAEEEFPKFTIIRNSTNNMFAKANNQAMRIAKGDYLLLLNSDCVVEAGNIEKLHGFLHARQPKVICVGPRLLNKDRSAQSEGHVFYSPWYAFCKATLASKWPVPVSLKRRILPPGYSRFDSGRARQVGWVTGAAMMIPARAITEIGLLDEAFFFYGEESEWCYRARIRGFEVWVYPAAEIVHLGGMSTTSDVLYEIDKVSTAQRLYHIERTGGKLRYCITAMIFLSVMPAVFFFFALFRKDLRPIKGLGTHALSVLRICLLPQPRRASQLGVPAA